MKDYGQHLSQEVKSQELLKVLTHQSKRIYLKVESFGSSPRVRKVRLLLPKQETWINFTDGVSNFPNSNLSTSYQFQRTLVKSKVDPSPQMVAKNS